jgi:hypothetical protein
MSELALEVVGQTSKRGLIPRQPGADRLLADIETWLRVEYPDIVRSTRTRTSAEAGRELLVGLHPAAEEISIGATDAGRVTMSADLGPVGPGYQRFVARLLERIELEHGVNWLSTVGENAHGVTDLAEVADRASAERSYLVWLGGRLITARDVRRRGGDDIHVGTPRGVRYTFDGAIATSLGPRDDDWLERAIGDSRLALDVTPWWADATDARFLLNRALCLMWNDVRWRAPMDELEQGVHDEVLRLLAKAFPLDPSLPYPWREWKELADYRGAVDAMIRQVEARASRMEWTEPIGYRRRPVRIVHEGWELEIPGTFADRRTDEEWWGGEAGRSITVAAVETGTDGEPMSPEGFLTQVASDLGPDALTHRSGEVVGRARLATDGSSGLEVGVLEGYSAVRGRGAAIRIVFDDSADWRWALDIWRDLSPVAREVVAPA